MQILYEKSKTLKQHGIMKNSATSLFLCDTSRSITRVRPLRCRSRVFLWDVSGFLGGILPTYPAVGILDSVIVISFICNHWHFS